MNSTTKSNQLDQSGDIARNQILKLVRQLMPRRTLTIREAESVAERQAQRLTQLLDLNGPVVDLDAIASLPNIELKVRPGLPVSGFSEWSRGRWVIAINHNDHPTRQRFTFAHEFKHVLDHPFIGDIYIDSNGKRDEQRAERMCDYFAACLLMPRPAVKILWGTGHQRKDDLAAHFGVSQAAMGHRLGRLGLSTATKRCSGQSPFGYERASRPSFAAALAQGSRVCP